MARYEVTGPDGARYEITAPDTASEQEVMQYAQSQFGRRSTDRQARIAEMQAEENRRRDDFERSLPAWQRAAINVGAGMDSAWQGAKQIGRRLTGDSGKTMSDLVTGGNSEDDAIREKRALDEYAASLITGGGALQIAGEVAPTLVLPAGAIVRGGQALGPVSGSPRPRRRVAWVCGEP